MERRLFLVSNNGGQAEYLPGVQKDVNNYLSFFKSDEGGAWEDSEIYCAPQWPRNYVLRILNEWAEGNVGYVLIVFTGHGGIVNDNVVIYPNNNETISIDELRMTIGDMRCHLITDSCQTIVESREHGGVIRGRMFCDSTDPVHKLKCRNRYMRAIELLPDGHFSWGSAVSYDQGAEDTSRGGLYSLSLLEVCKSLIKNDLKYPRGRWSFSILHDAAAERVMIQTDNDQTPFKFTNDDVYPPFLVKC